MPGDVGRDLKARGERRAATLRRRVVRFLGGGGVHAGSHASALRQARSAGDLGLAGEVAAARCGSALLNVGIEGPKREAGRPNRFSQFDHPTPSRTVMVRRLKAARRPQHCRPRRRP